MDAQGKWLAYGDGPRDCLGGVNDIAKVRQDAVGNMKDIENIVSRHEVYDGWNRLVDSALFSDAAAL